MSTSVVTPKELRSVWAALRNIPKEKKAAVVCALIGHSRIVSTFFGYVQCARCEAQIGDTLGGSSTLEEKVVMGHDCDTCRTNVLMMDWHDFEMVDESKVFPNAPKELLPCPSSK